MPKKLLTDAENDLIYLQERLAKAEAPFVSASWKDSVGSWLALADLLADLRCERGVAILECVFADEAVRRSQGSHTPRHCTRRLHDCTRLTVYACVHYVLVRRCSRRWASPSSSLSPTANRPTASSTPSSAA